MARDTLIDFFDDLSRARGDFLLYDDGFRSRTFTYEEIGRLARNFSARLNGLGLRKGDKVVFWSENRPEWIVAFWACLLRGIVVVPIDYRASPDWADQVRALTDIVGAELLMQVLRIKGGSMSGFGMAMRPVRMPGGTRTALPFFPTPD